MRARARSSKRCARPTSCSVTTSGARAGSPRSAPRRRLKRQRERAGAPARRRAPGTSPARLPAGRRRGEGVPRAVVQKLGRTLRDSDWKVTAVLVDDLLIDVEPGDTSSRRYAVAFDLGTTTVVATLLDLETGQPLAVRSLLNMQQPFGADVISRISATMLDPAALETLRARAHETLALLVAEICHESTIDIREIYEVVVTGNVTMISIA